MAILSTEHIGDYWAPQDRSNIIVGRSHFKQIRNADNFINTDLTVGFEHFTDHYGHEKLESILAYIAKIKASNPTYTLKQSVSGADFVARRGLLRTLAIMDYKTDYNDSWIAHAVRYNDVIFLCEEKQGNETESYNSRLGSYRGHKFEQIMTEQDVTRTPSNDSENKVVMMGKLQESNKTIGMFYSGEIDAIDSDGNPLEVKLVCGDLSDYWIRNKSLFWYMQSKLTNIEHIVYGSRYKNQLTRVRQISLDEIKIMGAGLWNENDCYNRLFTTLAYLQQHLKENGSAGKLTFINNTLSFEQESPNAFPFVSQSFLSKF